jgi:hypothetical protein
MNRRMKFFSFFSRKKKRESPKNTARPTIEIPADKPKSVRTTRKIHGTKRKNSN